MSRMIAGILDRVVEREPARRETLIRQCIRTRFDPGLQSYFPHDTGATCPENNPQAQASPILTLMSGTHARDAIAQRTSAVVELVGPAGSGKTTLLKSLASRNRQVMSGVLPKLRSVTDLPFLVRHGFQLTPVLLRLLSRHRGWLSAADLRCMITLSGWHRLCRSNAARNRKMLLLDQAAVFMMTQLYEFGPQILRTRTAEEWWKVVYAQWGATLDLIVWLDASDAILTERIRSRERWHMVKDRPEEEVHEFLARYRRAYERVISILTANPHRPRVLRIDTGHETIGETVRRVMLVLGL